MTDSASRNQAERNREEKKVTDAEYPAEKYDHVVREGVDVEQGEGEKKPRPANQHLDAPQSHMGAASGEMVHTKPATQELADLTDKRGQADTAEGDDYNPGDEVTPG
jgi:hypothetical protein